MSKLYELALTMLDGVGYSLGRQLVHHFGSAEAIFMASKKELIQIPGIGTITADKIRKSNALERAEEELLYLDKHQVDVLFFTDRAYPRRLGNCQDAPLLLYYKGEAHLNAMRVLSVVGTRNATPYGIGLCNQLAETLKGQDVLVVSGLAYGIDIAMHAACLKNGIPTVGVLGHGVDKIYPSSHSKIAHKMLANGGVLSEFPLNTTPERENFPKRNRVIAGMADAVIVVEAAKKGGALITADIANSYSRDVFAYPGRVGDAFSEGCNHLIKTNCAALINNAEDILYYMGWDDHTLKSNKSTQTALPLGLTESEIGIINFLQNGPAHVDSISHKMGVSQGKLATTLLNLELKGMISCLPGKLYKIL